MEGSTESVEDKLALQEHPGQESRGLRAPSSGMGVCHCPPPPWGVPVTGEPPSHAHLTALYGEEMVEHSWVTRCHPRHHYPTGKGHNLKLLAWWPKLTHLIQTETIMSHKVLR